MTQHRLLIGVCVLLTVASERVAPAQVPVGEAWRTIRTAHFDVHFTPQLEEPARRAAANAEDAYAKIAASLVPPRGRIDLVVADNVDFSNGYATPFPSNRIVVYATPPVSVPSLRFYDDWSQLVITHELVHIFHLDRARGWWRAGQRVFGRLPLLMPNLYVPAWVTEGLATYYESELTGAGRVRGSHQRMMVAASVLEAGLPRPDQWSLATSDFPGGEVAYAYGSLFLDFLARTPGGTERVGAFVEETSGAPIPFTLNRAARRSFGISFERAWRQWRDELRDSLTSTGPPLRDWRELTRRGRIALHPRWIDSTSLVFAASTGRASPAAYRVDLAGRVRRIGRRNGVGVNVPLGSGGLLFAQLEYVSPYHVRSDLFVQRGAEQRRITRAARLAEPDTRADGAIVAVQAAPATTRLVRVSADGRSITPITSASLDTQWAEPRWSPRGDRIAATRWTRGGYADIVILDTVGSVILEVTHDRATESSPSWTPDGASVLFASDRTGISDVYTAWLGCTAGADATVRAAPATEAGSPSRACNGVDDAAGTIGAPRRLSRAATGLFSPELRRDGALLAGVHYRMNGWHIGVAPFDTADADVPPLSESRAAPAIEAAGRVDAAVRRYSPWRSLWPRYWMPLVSSGVGPMVGGLTSGSDVVGRHAYLVQALVDTRTSDMEGAGSYRYSGLGVPILGVEVQQFWDRFALETATLARRTRTASLSATLARPRLRTNAFVSLTGELERRAYETDPAPFIEQLNFLDGPRPEYRGLVAATGWTNAQRPALSISPQDGGSVALAARQRWLAGVGPRSRSLSATLVGYKSIGGWTFADNVVAARLAGGIASGEDPGEFTVGGVSGSVLSVLPGISTGGRRTFPVRGFPPGSLSGTRAAVGSAELRMPLAAPSRGLGLWPFFLDRMSLSLFGDAGSAWTPQDSSEVKRRRVASVGGELNVDAAFQYDVAYRLRFGIARPVTGRARARAPAVSAYVSSGISF